MFCFYKKHTFSRIGDEVFMTQSELMIE